MTHGSSAPKLLVKAREMLAAASFRAGGPSVPTGTAFTCFTELRRFLHGVGYWQHSHTSNGDVWKIMRSRKDITEQNTWKRLSTPQPR